MQIIREVLRTLKTGGVRGVRDAIYHRHFSPAIHPINVAIDAITEKAGFSVIQIGAFIGNTDNDPLFRTLGERLREVHGKLIVIEPVRTFYEKLVENYKGVPGVVFENVAISDHSGPAAFYRLGVDPVAHGYPAWLSQLGSLKEERMTELWDQYEADKRLKDFYLAHRVQETVQCITFTELMSRHNLTKVDLLQVDVEGYEFEILRTIDFRKWPVRFVNYECVLLHKGKANAETLMREWGYRLVDYGQDTFCFKAGDKHLTRRWSRRANARGSA